ncbi:MAG: S41 family peptidase [Gammaproteobacteria bacterium]|nr:MAG: S41 family peptidase [Gammaproteobacteria bacterium]UTW42160.1 S41 family peptidase [bacterium SCSIO 12844]
MITYRLFRLGGMIIIFLIMICFTNVYAKGEDSQERLPVAEVQKFTQVLEIIRTLYVEKITDKEMLENAIEGMLERLDPHSTYLDEKELSDLSLATKGEFGGLGIEVTIEHGVVKVVAPIDDTPAQKAGIKAGDLIVRIDNHQVKGLTLTEAIDLMRGKKGTPITLTVVRVGSAKPLTFKIYRDIIKITSVKSRLIEDKYGYIRISAFQENTEKNLFKALEDLEKESNGKLEGIILDLRNNPGGILQAAVDVADMFLDANKLKYDKKIVYAKGRLKASKFEGISETSDASEGLPIVVLVNSGSASASEIVAGALQDHGRAIIMGIKTFGKGSVQTVLPLNGNSAVKITTARYYTPKGKSIQAEGVMPDITVNELEVPFDEEKSKLMAQWQIREEHLNHALEQNDDNTEEVLEVNDQEIVEEYTNKIKDKDKVQKHLVHEDYQLNEALNVLKAMIVIQNLAER